MIPTQRQVANELSAEDLIKKMRRQIAFMNFFTFLLLLALAPAGLLAAFKLYLLLTGMTCSYE